MSVDAFFTRLNPLVSGILRSPFHWLLSPGLLLITVTGRRSGRRYTIPVGYQRYGDTLIIMVSQAREKQWWRNYLEGGPAELRLRGKSVSGRAQTLSPGSDEFRTCAERTLRRLPFMAKQFKLEHRKGTPLTDAQLKHLAVEIAVVRIELDSASAVHG